MASRKDQTGDQPSFAKVAMTACNASHPLKTVPGMAAPDIVNSSPTKRHGSTDTPVIDDLSKAIHHFRLPETKSSESDSCEEIFDGGPLKTDGTFDDDQTHLSNSSTKPTSFDSKSMASVTTFAMDEKESLRPDDSASVQAAEEDDISGPASCAPSSQVGSEAGPRLNRIPDLMAPNRISGVVATNSSRHNDGSLRITGVLPGESASNPLSERSLHGFPNEPDEKLLEAMDSPKDRLLLLQLEEKIVAFIKNSSEQSLELPPCNAFGRLLAHKLGDYYHLTHFVDNNVTSVRLHRTPWCRLPTPLSTLHAVSSDKTPPPTVPAMKIMRRIGQPGEKSSGSGSTAPSSTAPSKAASETGVDGEDGTGSSAVATPAKDRAALTREEREAKYQAARERIFRDFPESKSSSSPNSGNQSANISRSNSRAGRKKNHRQKTPHDDSFEARSQFNAYYPGAPYSSSQMSFNGIAPEGSFIPQNNYALGHPASTGMNFPHTNHQSSIYPPPGNTNGIPNYPMGMPSQLPQGGWQSSQYPNFHQAGQVNSVMSQQSSTRSSPALNSYALPTGAQYPQSPPPWGQPSYQGNYPSPTGARNPNAAHWSNVPPNTVAAAQMPYPYGQAPSQPFVPGAPNSPSQHSIPGNFARPSFNPQSRSFAPGNGTHQRYADNIAQPTASQPHNSHFSTTPPWQSSQGLPSRLQSYQPGIQAGVKASPAPLNSNTMLSHGRPIESQNSIAKWGTPSHLPPKPPPSEVPYEFDRTNRTSSTAPQASQNYINDTPAPAKPAPTNTGPLVVSGGTNQQQSYSHGNRTGAI